MKKRPSFRALFSGLVFAISACTMAPQAPSPLPPTSVAPPVLGPLAGLFPSRSLLALTNDEFTGALPIQLDERVAVDTSQATHNTADPISNCGYALTGAWYTFTASTEQEVELWLLHDSETAPVAAVYDGAADPANQVSSCPFNYDGNLPGFQRMIFTAQAGHPYMIHVGVPEGQPQVSFRFFVTPFVPLAVEVTVDPTGIRDPNTNQVTVSGTVTSNKPIMLDDLSFSLYQRVGRVPIYGSSNSEFSDEPIFVDGQASWSRTTVFSSGTWTGGAAEVTVFYRDFNNEEFFDRALTSTIRLKGKR